MKHLGLFEGIGGFSLAARWMGWETVAWCEWNEFGQKVLRHHFPKAEGFGDITKTDFTKYEGKIDIITGGFPCQPFSLAGKRKGADDERYLWHEMLRAIQEVKPKFVIAENVFVITNIDGGLVFEQVCLDLENEGYEVQPFIIPAAAKNAPHRRDRCWFIAYSTNNGCEQSWPRVNQWQEHKSCHRIKIWNLASTDGKKPNATNTNCDGCDKCNCNNEKHTSKRGFDALNDINEVAMHTNGTSKQGKHIGQTREGKFNGPDSGNGFDNFQNFPTQSPICNGDDGISDRLVGITFPKWRNESIKAMGNAIVPQIAFELFRALHEMQSKPDFWVN
jgi:DNA (cytosine-5)-methyltransferase 1